MELTELISIILSTSAFVVSLLTYLRDRHKISVEISLNKKVYNSPLHDPKKTYLVLTAVNCGRRPTVIKSPCMIFFDGTSEGTLGIFADALSVNANKKLEEGDTTKYLCEQSSFEERCKDKVFLCGMVETGQGTRWYSKPESLRGKLLLFKVRLERRFYRLFPKKK